MKAQVFVASSLKAIADGGPAHTLRFLLKEQLRDTADIEPWTRQFELGAVYIESLEKASGAADFAVVIATPDDLVTRSDTQKMAPRDNVVFELGLFMGRIGRDRCFVVQQEDLHLPTDLLGVETAKFKMPADGNLKSALDFASLRIAERIRDLKVREKLTPEGVNARKTLRAFATQIEGAWWERVLRDDKKDASALSFFKIELDSVTNSITLNGRSYGVEGDAAATWRSEITRAANDRRTLHYAWTGRAVQPAVANRQFNGVGHMNFEAAASLGGPISRGEGLFWNVDEMQPEETIVKPIELRRISDSNDVVTMTTGTQEDKRALVVKTLAQW